MSEQSEQARSMPITESELRWLCDVLADHFDEQCDFIEAKALEAHSQENLDTVGGFLLKAYYAEELWYGEGSEMNPLKCDIFKLMSAVERVRAIRNERLGALLPQ